MTREEEYYRYCTKIEHDTYQHEGQPCIEDAIEWADTHPKNPWHLIADEYLPKEGTFWVTNYAMYIPSLCNYNNVVDRWMVGYGGDVYPYTENDIRNKYTHFMPIPELPQQNINNIEKNIFEGAKFGDVFIRRDGLRAIYHASKAVREDLTVHYLMIEPYVYEEGENIIFYEEYVNKDGKGYPRNLRSYNLENPECPNYGAVIVSHY